MIIFRPQETLGETADRVLKRFAAGMNAQLNERIKSVEIKEKLEKELFIAAGQCGLIHHDEEFLDMVGVILSKYDIKEKPAPSLLDRIEEAKVKCLMQNIKPTSIYLGQEEVSAFKNETRDLIKPHLSGVVEGSMYDGMTVYCLKTFTHLKIC